MGMRPRDAANGNEPVRKPEPKAASIARLFGPDRKAIADLTAIVEEALEMADAMELGLVGIDLCSALVQLKDIGDGSYLMDQRDCE
jgi:hypothetical protein